ncbi:MAG: TetM/TetW/TetO/TetS family tetracycline resistance ribosomal protection protein [Clostridia bacterium]|nr:TetM/TetW/TetO/TetS family tetracycline resistance ribosomal protection protein [Clostridia bacterium]
MKTCSIGIFAHVDAGKTTLSEQLLLSSGAIRTPGSVDRGTAHTDRMDIERRRGISVRSTCAPLSWNGARVNLIDTPGHSDFSAEVEKSMWALDGAVLLLSGVDGVQPQAEVLFESLRSQRIPTLIFVNKMDREGADFNAVLTQARERLHAGVTPLFDDDALMAAIAEQDDQALEDYLSGTIYPRSRLLARAKDLTREMALFPMLSGSALKGEGIEPLLDAVTTLLMPDDSSSDGDELCGIVFALDEDPVMGRGAYVRVFSGALRNRDQLNLAIPREGAYLSAIHTEPRKITQIRDIALEGRGEDKGALTAGEIGVVYGLGDVSAGQILGNEALLPRVMGRGKLKAPLMMVRVLPENPEKKPELMKALHQLSAEDPLLDVRQFLGEMHVRIMGAIQMEILAEQMKTRFGLNVTFAEPQVIYRETIRQAAEGFVAYTMPKPCWAVIKLLIEPAPRGSGVSFRSVVPVRTIKERYQHQVEQGLVMGLKQGMLGWQVDDVSITLIDGSDHQWHTHPLDFIVATPMALMDGLRRGGSVLLEPIAEMRVTVPATLSGRVMSEIVAMRGETLRTESLESRDAMVLVAEAPVRTSFDFPTRLAAITGGRGALTMRVSRYQECPEEHTCPRAGVNPLDTAKYILAARSALEGEIFS